jgi:hypothetical protein
MFDILFIISCIILFRLVQSANREVVHIKRPLSNKKKPRLDELVNWIMSFREVSSIRLNAILYCFYAGEISSYGESCIDRPFIAYKEGFMIKELRDIFGTTKEYAKIKPISDKKAEANPKIIKSLVGIIRSLDDYTDEGIIDLVTHTFIYAETSLCEDKILRPDTILKYLNN